MKQILVIEDDRGSALACSQILKSKGYKVTVAANGKDGLEKLGMFTPDLIILDINMPVMNGLEFYEQICTEDKEPRYPILVLSGLTGLESIFQNLHIEGYMIKPVQDYDLFHEVDIIFRMQHIAKSNRNKRVILIDGSQEAEEIQKVFSAAGYKVETSDSGVWGIEKVNMNPPGLAVINIGLKDLAGDLVVLRLHQMAKTRQVPCILYAYQAQKHELDRIIMEKFSEKSGVKRMCVYRNPKELLQAATEVLKEYSQSSK